MELNSSVCLDLSMIDAWSHLALIWVGEVSHKDVAVILDDSSKFGSHPKWHD